MRSQTVVNAGESSVEPARVRADRESRGRPHRRRRKRANEREPFNRVSESIAASRERRSTRSEVRARRSNWATARRNTFDFRSEGETRRQSARGVSLRANEKFDDVFSNERVWGGAGGAVGSVDVDAISMRRDRAMRARPGARGERRRETD